ncbi:hypothetical protein DENSPDRAFT_125144 [Dentipellis sp. KUC8613]|nr:hypothetical protein DENSPDRAFT_125144 [Dentipellis sp. KUC8613]
MTSYESRLKKILDSRAKQIRAKDEEIQAKDQEIQELMHMLKEAERKSSTGARSSCTSTQNKEKDTVEKANGNKRRKVNLPSQFVAQQTTRKPSEADPDLIILNDIPVRVKQRARAAARYSEVIEIMDSEDEDPPAVPLSEIDGENLARPELIDAFRRVLRAHFVGPRSIAGRRSEQALSALEVNRNQGVTISAPTMASLLGPALFWRNCSDDRLRQPFRVRLSSHPCAPLQPGEPGLYFELCPKNDTWPKTLPLFVSGRPSKCCLYMGEYELVDVNPPFLSAEQWSTLHSVTRSQWVRKIEESPVEDCAEISARIVFRLLNSGREPTADEVKALMKRKTRASKHEVHAALGVGEECLKVWGLRCVGWDEDLVKRIMARTGRGDLRKRPRA